MANCRASDRRASNTTARRTRRATRTFQCALTEAMRVDDLKSPQRCVCICASSHRRMGRMSAYHAENAHARRIARLPPRCSSPGPRTHNLRRRPCSRCNSSWPRCPSCGNEAHLYADYASGGRCVTRARANSIPEEDSPCLLDQAVLYSERRGAGNGHPLTGRLQALKFGYL